MHRLWECKYRLPNNTKYFYTNVEAVYQHEAKKIFEASMPSAIICGNPRQIPLCDI